MTIINARFLTQNITGVQRYATEISTRLNQFDSSFDFISPKGIIQNNIASQLGVKEAGCFNGHLWEQLSLPSYCKNYNSPLLVSFSGIGPLFYKNRITTVHDLAFYRHPEWFSKSYAI